MSAYLTFVVKNALLGVPLVRRLYRYRQVQRGYDSNKDAAAYPLGVFRKHSELLGHIAGADVLEIGPGGNLAVALQFLLAGARSVTAIDLVPYAGADLGALYDQIASAAGYAGNGCRVREIRYIAPINAERSGLPTASFDIIYSHACFEHFSQPGRVIDEIRRLLRTRGRTSHQIDLADHRDKGAPLDFLRYSDFAWNLACSNGGNWATNRWRSSDFRAAFSSGFDLASWSVTDRCSPDATPRHRLARRFRGIGDDDLTTIGLLLSARRA